MNNASYHSVQSNKASIVTNKKIVIRPTYNLYISQLHGQSWGCCITLQCFSAKVRFAITSICAYKYVQYFYTIGIIIYSLKQYLFLFQVTQRDTTLHCHSGQKIGRVVKTYLLSSYGAKSLKKQNHNNIKRLGNRYQCMIFKI